MQPEAPNPPVQNSVANEQLMMLLKLQGSAAQILSNHVNESANKKKKMEDADILHHVEECRRREDVMMLLEKNITATYLPMIFGVDDSEAGLQINLSNRCVPKAKYINIDGEDPVGEDTSVSRSAVGSLIAELDPIPLPDWEEYKRVPAKKIATLLLANNNPMFSVCSEINPYPDQCLREVLPGASMIVVPTFDLLCQMADTLLTETLVQICMAKMDRGEDVRDSEITLVDVRAGLRSMDKCLKF